MKPTAFLAAGLLLTASVLGAASVNELTPAEKSAGWRLLFDGKSTKGWRGFNKTEFPSQRWVVRDGALVVLGAGTGDSHGGGDIVTTEKFSDFDLRWQWRVAPGANSGVKYLVDEKRGEPIAHEYQILDDDKHPDAKVGPHRQAAAFYDVLPPAPDKPLRPVGEWNSSRVVVKGNHVEHWLNGKKVLQYELGSPEIRAAIAKSKFKDVAGFDAKLTGPILLQDHGDEVAYRNIKILAKP